MGGTGGFPPNFLYFFPFPMNNLVHCVCVCACMCVRIYIYIYMPVPKIAAAGECVPFLEYRMCYLVCPKNLRQK